MKKLKAFEKAMVTWTIEHPRQYRAIVTVVFSLSAIVQVQVLTESL